MGKKEDKTNVMRILDQKKIEYNHYSYDNMTTCAKDVAAGLGVDPQFLYKTLVTVGKSKEHYVFMVPGEEELDLKKAAIAVGEKSIEMIHNYPHKRRRCGQDFLLRRQNRQAGRTVTEGFGKNNSPSIQGHNKIKNAHWIHGTIKQSVKASCSAPMRVFLCSDEFIFTFYSTKFTKTQIRLHCILKISII